MPDNLRERVVATVRQVLGPNVDIKNTKLQLSSLKMLELIVALETEFGVQISEEGLEEVDRLGQNFDPDFRRRIEPGQFLGFGHGIVQRA